MSTQTKTTIDEIFEYVESFENKLHRVDVFGGLPHMNQATVEAGLAKLAGMQKILRPARGYYQRLPRDGEALPPSNLPGWLRPGATPSAKILAYLEAKGPQPKSYVISACGTGGIRDAIDSMVRAGELSYTGAPGSVIRVGAPAAREAQRHTARSRWHNGLPPVDLKAPNPAATPEPAPIESAESRPVLDLVLEDLKARREMGIAKYGRELHTHNGRDTLMDAYQEALDLVMYLRAEIEQRDEYRAAGECADRRIRDAVAERVEAANA